jgi:hypothetical protein
MILGNTHFNLNEATRSEVADIRVDPDPVQISMHVALAWLVEELFRTPLGVPVKINSGQRSRAIYLSLIAAGYHPSIRSDHFFGEEINGWRWSSGAWDITIPSEIDNIFKIYEDTVKRLRESAGLEARVGQMIVYPADRFIHVSNSAIVSYGAMTGRSIQDLAQKRRYLISNGSKYEVYP